MTEFRVMGKVKHNDLVYIVLMDKNYQKYFLKHSENNKYTYPSIEELKELNKKLLLNDCIYSGRKSYFIEPFVYVGKKLLPWALAISMSTSLTGCIGTPEKTIDVLANQGITVEKEFKSIYFISDVDVDKIGNNDLGISSSTFIDISFDETCTPEEFGEYIGSSIISWDDILITLENADMPNQLKAILYYGIDNLIASGFDMNLSVLNHNLKNIEIENVDATTINGNAGIFDHINSRVLLDSNLDFNSPFAREVLIHEILGHGMTRAYYNGDEKVICDVAKSMFLINDEGELIESGVFGISSTEGIAEIITVMANGELLSHERASYTADTFALIMLCKSVGWTVEDFANKGMESLIDEMKRIGIEDPYYMILSIDINLISARKGIAIEPANSVGNIINLYLEEMIILKIKEGLSKEEIDMYIHSMFTTVDKYIKYDQVEGLKLIIYNIEGITDSVLPEMMEAHLLEMSNQKLNNKTK